MPGLTMVREWISLANSALTCVTFCYVATLVYRYSLEKLRLLNKPLCARRTEESS